MSSYNPSEQVFTKWDSIVPFQLSATASTHPNIAWACIGHINNVAEATNRYFTLTSAANTQTSSSTTTQQKEAAVDVNSSPLSGWLNSSISNQFTPWGTVFVNTTSDVLLPAKPGNWTAYSIYNTKQSISSIVQGGKRNEPLLCAVLFAHDEFIHNEKDAARLLLHAPGVGENVPSKEAMKDHIRFIGRYDWDYYRTFPEKGQEVCIPWPDRDTYCPFIGPVAMMVDPTTSKDLLLPWYKVALDDGRGAKYEDYWKHGSEFQSDVQGGLAVIGKEQGAMAHFAHAEYMFGRVWFEVGNEGKETHVDSQEESPNKRRRCQSSEQDELKEEEEEEEKVEEEEKEVEEEVEVEEVPLVQKDDEDEDEDVEMKKPKQKQEEQEQGSSVEVAKALLVFTYNMPDFFDETTVGSTAVSEFLPKFFAATQSCSGDSSGGSVSSGGGGSENLSSLDMNVLKELIATSCSTSYINNFILELLNAGESHRLKALLMCLPPNVQVLESHVTSALRMSTCSTSTISSSLPSSSAPSPSSLVEAALVILEHANTSGLLQQLESKQKRGVQLIQEQGTAVDSKVIEKEMGPYYIGGTCLLSQAKSIKLADYLLQVGMTPLPGIRTNYHDHQKSFICYPFLESCFNSPLDVLDIILASQDASVASSLVQDTVTTSEPDFPTFGEKDSHEVSHIPVIAKLCAGDLEKTKIFVRYGADVQFLTPKPLLYYWYVLAVKKFSYIRSNVRKPSEIPFGCISNPTVTDTDTQSFLDRLKADLTVLVEEYHVTTNIDLKYESKYQGKDLSLLNSLFQSFIQMSP